MTTETARYIEAVGRRKTSIARVRITPATKASYLINEHRDLEHYFTVAEHRRIINDPFAVTKLGTKFKVTAHINGGGVSSQAEALRHAIARALIIYDINLRGVVKKAGHLKRDPRQKERRKFGLKKARKAPQWSKR